MTSTEDVPRVSCSIGARQAEPLAPQNGRVHAFSRCGTIPERSLMGVFLARNEKKRLPQCPNSPLHQIPAAICRWRLSVRALGYPFGYPWISIWISMDIRPSLICRPTGPRAFGTEQLDVLKLHASAPPLHLPPPNPPASESTPGPGRPLSPPTLPPTPSLLSRIVPARSRRSMLAGAPPLRARCRPCCGPCRARRWREG